MIKEVLLGLLIGAIITIPISIITNLLLFKIEEKLGWWNK